MHNYASYLFTKKAALGKILKKYSKRENGIVAYVN